MPSDGHKILSIVRLRVGRPRNKATAMTIISLVPRPSHPFHCPVFDCLQYAKTEGKAWSILSHE